MAAWKCPMRALPLDSAGDRWGAQSFVGRSLPRQPVVTHCQFVMLHLSMALKARAQQLSTGRKPGGSQLAAIVLLNGILRLQ
ncbi:Hypothetical protein NTJ_04842 [Nesidiocoris tenuis]|uniref:Uncharacterized protein n=1 Tax=Nesidiocoris tenuis TaxID=355587 RepID=A0ABN7AIH0_9HEMI|nr:Hypothetical protein NTJ_04842 [Nesidiocoris tenuis]